MQPRYTTITSTDNSLVKEIVRLQSSKYRTQEHMFTAEGMRTCATLADNGNELIYVFCIDKKLSEAESLGSDNEKIIVVSSHVMEKISSSTTPSGLLCVFKIPRPAFDTITTPGLVLAGISDPGNMGTLIRTAAALNIKSVVAVESCDPWSPKVIQASAGTIGLVKIYQTSWDTFVKKTHNIDLCALVVRDGSTPDEVDLHDKLLVIGNEAHGLPQEWLNDCTTRMTLPMAGAAESLNAGVAGSIALYLAATAKK